MHASDDDFAYNGKHSHWVTTNISFSIMLASNVLDVDGTKRWLDKQSHFG